MMFTRSLTAVALTAGILTAGASPALAHGGFPGEYGQEKYQTACSSGAAGTVRHQKRMFNRTPDTRMIQTGATVTNRDGKHFHIVIVQRRTSRGWVTIERRRVAGCGYVKPTRVMAPGASTVLAAGRKLT